MVEGGKCSYFKYVTYLCSKKGEKNREKEEAVVCIQSDASVLNAFVRNSLLS